MASSRVRLPPLPTRVRLLVQVQTKDQSKWLQAAISYFDLLANGYIASNAFLTIYSSLEALKTQPTDYKGMQAQYLAWVELRQAYLFLYWLFFQNTLDLLNIQAAVGVPVDAKVHDYYKGMVPWVQVPPASPPLAPCPATRAPLPPLPAYAARAARRTTRSCTTHLASCLYI